MFSEDADSAVGAIICMPDDAFTIDFHATPLCGVELEPPASFGALAC